MIQVSKINNDMNDYNIEKCNWKIIKNNGKFSLERSGHSCFIHNDFLYVFGGISIHNGQYLNDIGCLDLSILKN